LDGAGYALECRLVQHLGFGAERILLGQVVAASMDREAVEADDPLAYLRLFTFLENGTYGVIEKGRRFREKSDLGVDSLSI